MWSSQNSANMYNIDRFGFFVGPVKYINVRGSGNDLASSYYRYRCDKINEV